MKRTWICGIVALMQAWMNLAVSQERSRRPMPPTLPEGVRVLRDLQYVEGGHERNRLDLYLPERVEGQLPLVVWIHGGAWQAGSKDGCPAVPLTTKGYAVASVNYRLSQHAIFPAQIEDCKAAIRWLRANAAKYHLDPRCIGAWGASAGGHLVAMLGTTGAVKDLEGHGGNLDQSSRVQCVVDWFGPSNLLTMGGRHDDTDSPESRLIGGPVQENKERARKASPLTYVSKDSAPFLIMHGDQDHVVPLNQSQVLAEAIRKAGVEVTLQVVKGNGHGGPEFANPENRKLIEDFLAKHLGVARSIPTTETQPLSKPRRVAVTISKATTYLTEPMRKDGYVDYVAALNQRCRQGVTLENNAAVPFLKAMGLSEISPKYRTEYFRMLGIPPLAETGEYYVKLEEYAKRVPDSGERKPEKIADELRLAMKRPWSKKEFPILAGWLAANDKPLALLVEASQRPRRYDPLISGGGMVLAILLPAVPQYREAAKALSARAMFRANEGQVAAAWEDLLACHRLARLVGQGPTLVELLFGVTVDGVACAGDRGLLQHGELTASQAAKMCDDLIRLPPMPRMADKIDSAERYLFLDCVGTVAREGIGALAVLDSDDSLTKTTIRSLIGSVAWATADWDVALRMGNSWYDRLAAACRQPTAPGRAAELRTIDADVRKLVAKAKDWEHLGLSILGNPRKAVSEWVGRVLVAVLLPTIGHVNLAEDRRAMQFDLIRLGLALAAYRADHNSYPARLADLTPKYITTVPQDIFSGAGLRYRQDGNGCLVYSVGSNGKDDGAKGDEDRKRGEDWDDLVVRVPASEKQGKKQ